MAAAFEEQLINVLAKTFHREQTGFDAGQFFIFLLIWAALISSLIVAQDYAIPAYVPNVMWAFGLCLLLLDFAYVTLSIVFTGGNWRQYCVYFILIAVGLPLIIGMLLPGLAHAKE